MQLAKEDLRLGFADIFILVIGCIMMAISLNLFFNPHGIASGGITGLAVVLNMLFGIPLWIVNLVLNIPLFIAAYKILSKRDCIKTVLGIILLTVALKFTESMSLMNITNDIYLVIIMGSILMGIGQGLILRINGSTGGTDLMALLINRLFPTLSIPIRLGIVDCTVIVLSGIVTGQIEIAMYSSVSLYIIIKMSDLMIEGFDYSKSFMIISDKYREITDRIMSDLDRGATFLKGEGAYTGEAKNVVFVVVGKKQVVELKRMVREIDPKAFVIVSDIHEALGDGFKPVSKEE
ncbi:YitT family protein [Peptacetobacter hominis]|uniref:YitT family protein n=1 Tax=Peptacetobacter hominis TaxID=2743610 RepID=A0A544QXF7_9FIRM|nr:YitT family protein [Peptacetobacter hominis]